MSGKRNSAAGGGGKSNMNNASEVSSDNDDENKEEEEEKTTVLTVEDARRIVKKYCGRKVKVQFNVSNTKTPKLRWYDGVITKGRYCTDVEWDDDGRTMKETVVETDPKEFLYFIEFGDQSDKYYNVQKLIEDEVIQFIPEPSKKKRGAETTTTTTRKRKKMTTATKGTRKSSRK